MDWRTKHRPPLGLPPGLTRAGYESVGAQTDHVTWWVSTDFTLKSERGEPVEDVAQDLAQGESQRGSLGLPGAKAVMNTALWLG